MFLYEYASGVNVPLKQCTSILQYRNIREDKWKLFIKFWECSQLTPVSVVKWAHIGPWSMFMCNMIEEIENSYIFCFMSYYLHNLWFLFLSRQICLLWNRRCLWKYNNYEYLVRENAWSSVYVYVCVYKREKDRDRE
jgi:hypothetical protein